MAYCTVFYTRGRRVTAAAAPERVDSPLPRRSFTRLRRPREHLVPQPLQGRRRRLRYSRLAASCTALDGRSAFPLLCRDDCRPRPTGLRHACDTAAAVVPPSSLLCAATMDAASIPALSSLLTGATPPSTRAAACSAIAASTSPASAAPLRRAIGTTADGETLLRRLLQLCADPPCARLALSALLNLAEDHDAAVAQTRAGAVRRAADAVLDRDMPALYAGLLANLTRFEEGVSALVGGEGEGGRDVAAEARVLRLVERVGELANVLWLSNVCVSARGRAVLFGQAGVGGTQPMARLLALLGVPEVEKRLAAASGLRNCAMAEDCHAALVGGTEAVRLCLGRFEGVVGEREGRGEGVAEIRVILVEAMLLLCQSRIGRDALREGGAFEVLEKWKGERAEMLAIESVLDRLAVAEDGEEVDVEKVVGGMGGGFVQTIDA